MDHVSCLKGIPEHNYTAYARFLLVLFIKVSQVTHSFETRKKTPANGLYPHGPSMYTLSMVCTCLTNACENKLCNHR